MPGRVGGRQQLLRQPAKPVVRLCPPGCSDSCGMGRDVEMGERVTGGSNNFGLVWCLGGSWAEVTVFSHCLCIPLALCKW